MKKIHLFAYLFLLCFAQSLSCDELLAKTSVTSEEALKEVNKAKALGAEQAKVAIQSQISSLREHDINKAYYAFTSKAFRASTSRDDFQRFIFDNPVFSKNMTLELGSPMFQENLIIFQGTMTSIDNQKNSVEFAVTKEDNDWKIFGVKVFAAPVEK